MSGYDPPLRASPKNVLATYDIASDKDLTGRLLTTATGLWRRVAN